MMPSLFGRGIEQKYGDTLLICTWRVYTKAPHVLWQPLWTSRRLRSDFGPSAGSIRDIGCTDILDRINLNGVSQLSRREAIENNAGSPSFDLCSWSVHGSAAKPRRLVSFPLVCCSNEASTQLILPTGWGPSRIRERRLCSIECVHRL